tara:strand:- start:189 stop:503 length:315 start_codon:yes stop_codon:yes gene_type:complete
MAHKTYQYCLAKNWGKGFIEIVDDFETTSFPGNIWRVPVHNKRANLWINKVLGVPKTVSEAQAIVDVRISELQTAWDNDNVDGETTEEKQDRLGFRQPAVTLEE